MVTRKRIVDGIEQVVYPNGLTLALRAGGDVPVAAVRCWVRGGSIAEEAPGGRGIAHLLEHLVGTAAAAEMEQHDDGALLNAFTTYDATCYHWSALEEDLAGSLRRFFAALRRVRALSFDLEPEKAVALQEIGQFREKHLAVFQQCFLEETFDVHPLRFPVCGDPSLLRDVTADDLGRYLARVYSGANLRLVVSGAFDEHEVVDAVEEECLSIAAGHRFELSIDEPERATARRFSVDVAALRCQSTQIGLRMIGGDTAAVPALAQRAGGLRRELLDGGVARDVEVRSVVSAFGAATFNVLVHHDGNGHGNDAEASVRRWLAGVAAGKTPIVPEPDAGAAADDDIRAAVRRHLRDGNLTIGRLQARDRATAPRPARSAPAEHEETLPNGVQLLILPSPSTTASCQLLWRGGVLAESEAANGLCSLMARLLPHAIPAESRTGIYAFCDENFFGVSLTASERDLDARLDLLARMATQPAFTPEVVDQERQDTIDHLASPMPWMGDLHAQLKRHLYRRHPYRLSAIGTPESLARLAIDDVVDCHRRMCIGGNTAVVLSGTSAPAAMRERLASLFASFPSGAFESRPEPAEPDAEPATAVLARPWSFGALALGYRGIAWEPETWSAIELMKALLVGPENNSVRGRLARALREEGAAYTIQAWNHAGFGEGYFALLAAYAPGKEERTVAIVRQEIERLCSGDIAGAELDHCRKLYILQHLGQYESPRTNAYNAARRLLFASRPGSWQGIVEQLRGIGVGDVAAAARRVFCEQRRQLVITRPEGH
ncbi:MAG TPA: insulinase family protein [Thermoanaerobaculia bacterium]|nr:insulinase family protein [Thermoanaerobaculia bacterium]